MKCIQIITPVKDSIELTLQTVEAIVASDFQTPFTYTVYNDFSTEEKTAKLQDASEKLGFELVNLAEITDHPSPNYLLVLQMAQQRAIEAEAGLIIVESDVVVKKNTLQALFNGAAERADCGIAAAVTVDEKGEINYPYLFRIQLMEVECFLEIQCQQGTAETAMLFLRKHLVFLTFRKKIGIVDFLKAFDLHQLNPEKNWHDVTVSHQSLKEGFKNYLFTTLPVLHQPHGSRPWKQLKYKNPLKYYWLKYTKGLDKI